MKNNIKKLNNLNIIPVLIYSDCDLEKVNIFKDNRNKSGIYCWINNINHKIYIGSSTNLTDRFYKYYHYKHLSERNIYIHNALLKYGYQNFSLAIIEYVTEKENVVKREQYYLDLLKPEYNILATAGSSLGYKHTEETLKFFREDRKVSIETRKNLSIAATDRILPEELKERLSKIRKGINLSTETRTRISEYAIKTRGISINIFNIETNEELSFDNLTAAAKHVGVSRTALSKALKNGNLVKGIFKLSQ